MWSSSSISRVVAEMSIVHVVAHPTREEARELLRTLIDWASACGHELTVDEHSAASLLGADAAGLAAPGPGSGTGLIVSLGGDGTMLRAVAAAAAHASEAPLLGVDLGSLGYLSQVHAADGLAAIERALTDAATGGWWVDERMMLDVKVNGEPVACVLNEVVVEKGAPGTAVRLGVIIDGELFATLASDGVIVSTPTGSTAYSLSARGPIVSPRHRAVLVTPVAPHMLFDRTMVLDPSETVEVEVLGEDLSGNRFAVVAEWSFDEGAVAIEPGLRQGTYRIIGMAEGIHTIVATNGSASGEFDVQNHLGDPWSLQIRADVDRGEQGQRIPVTIRLLDPPLHEFLPPLEELKVKEATEGLSDQEKAELEAAESWAEHNPMIGTRGVRLGVIKPGLYAMQVRALLDAAAKLREAGGRPIVEIMIPLTVTREELALARSWVQGEIDEALKGMKKKPVITIGTMVETPRAAVRADEIAEASDFFSFGTNDLTQLTFGFSRDDVESRMMPAYLEQGLLKRNPFDTIDQSGVGDLVMIGAERGRATKPELKLGVCGEHGGDPESIDLFYRAGLDYVSCSPFRVPVARLACAQAIITHG